MTIRLSDEILKASIEAVRETAGNVILAANNLGIARTTLSSRLQMARQRGLDVPEATGKFAIPDAQILDAAEKNAQERTERREDRTFTYWKRRAGNLEKELQSVEHALAEIAGLRDCDIEIPHWLSGPKSGKKARSIVNLLVSDVHAGEVVLADELLNLGEFNIDICRKRLRKLFAAACNLGIDWSESTNNEGCVLYLAGDLISGDIHEELRITNELTSIEQVHFMVAECAAGIAELKKAFKRVHVVSVPGNHGRATAEKKMFKLYSRLSYDTLIADILREKFAGDSNLSFQVGASSDQIVPVFGKFPVHVTHGDRIGAGGGQGFIGPMAPIVRGSKRVFAQQAQAGRTPYWIVHGHFHTSGQPGSVFSNGSVPGYTEYANGLRASLEPPQQWCWLMDSDWGVRERCEIRLEAVEFRPLANVNSAPGFLSAA